MTKDTKLILDQLAALHEDNKSIYGELAEMRGDIKELQEDNKSLKSSITVLNLRIENEIQPAIGFLADGHLDLMRKMDEVLEIHHDREMYIARLNKVENDVEMLKSQMKHTA